MNKEHNENNLNYSCYCFKNETENWEKRAQALFT